MPPPDDFKQFQDGFKRVAQSQEIQLTEVQMKQYRLLKNLHPRQSAKVAIRIDEAIMEAAEIIWQTPVSVPPTCRRADKKYFVPSKNLEFLFNHPQLNSLVVDAAQQRAKTPQYKATPDIKKLDLFGRKIYSSATPCHSSQIFSLRTRGPAIPQIRDPSPNSVAPSWFKVEEHFCSEAVKTVLLNSRRETTRRTYLEKWKRFMAWCKNSDIESHLAPMHKILDLYPLSRPSRSLYLYPEGTPISNYRLPCNHRWSAHLCSPLDQEIA
nr:uncharacterized protein LOC112544999 [Pelodiscus sinensis]|eukprot:XP_025037998.1 uncharacterized protein LOC112544999 [Pelodiscus sinensis]